jgi:hypothetical protein
VTDPARDTASSDATASPSDVTSSTDSPAASGRAAADDHRSVISWERSDWLACLLIALVTVVLAGLHIRAYPTLSPFDELQHIDYVIKAGDFEIPRTNDLVGQEALSEAACRGVDVSAIPTESGLRQRRGSAGAGPQSIRTPVSPIAQSDPPQCGDEVFDPADFQENGVNTAASQLPLYYTPTGVLSRAITATGFIDSQVTAARLVNSVWFAASWAVIWYAMSLVGARRPQRALVVTMLIASPLILFHSATINVDAVLMLTGAIVLVAALYFEAGRIGGLALLAVAAALYFVEPTVFLAMCAAAAFLVGRVSSRPDLATWRRVVPLMIFPLILVLRWAEPRLQSALFPASPRTNRPTMFADNALPDGGLDWGRILAQYDATFLPINNAHLAPFIDTTSTAITVAISNWFLIVVLLAVALRLVGDRRLAWLSGATLVTALVAGPFRMWSFAVFSDADFETPGRFGLPLIGFVTVVAAGALRHRWVMSIGWVIAITAFMNGLVLLTTA